MNKTPTGRLFWPDKADKECERECGSLEMLNIVMGGWKKVFFLPSGEGQVRGEDGRSRCDVA